MKRKPRFYVEYCAAGVVENGQRFGKSTKRLCTYDELVFMLRLANPFQADVWMFTVNSLKRRDCATIRVNHLDGIQGIKVTRR